MNITVAGAGAFGTGLAIALARTGRVTLWGRNPDQMAELQTTRENARHLPNCRLPNALQPTADTACFETVELVLLCIPTQQITSFLRANAAALADRSIIACCKGIDLATGKGPADVIQNELPQAKVALLTGPSFAIDIAQGLPTALTLACLDPETAENLQRALTRPTLRIYRTTDVSGAQLGGALKNVMAIAAGATMGSGLGESARAAVITRGYAEMQKFAANRGADPETMMGLSGLGDLVLTCTSETSRNYSYGLALGKGEPFDPSKTVEGAHTAKAVAALAAGEGIDMPICVAVDDLVQGRANVSEVLRVLLSRPLKEE
ncbi:MAG: NAD(P)H-dependent glycerol-3-phosphate dehydrogenase [Aliishimia sp.]